MRSVIAALRAWMFWLPLIVAVMAACLARAQYDTGEYVGYAAWPPCQPEQDCLIPVPGADYSNTWAVPGPDQPGARPNKGFDVTSGVPQWMASLIRPDDAPSPCCGKADAYPVEVIEDGGTDHAWRVKIIDGSSIVYPDKTHRAFIPNGTQFQVAPSHVTKPNQGNPTKTAWLFVGLYPAYFLAWIYCLVPLPPSF